MHANSTNTSQQVAATPLAGARVLVTGAAGFFGAHLCRALTAAAAVAIGVSRAPRGTACAEAFLGDCADLTFVRGVIAASKPHIIYHLAGSADGSRDLSHVNSSLQDDLTSTVNLLTAATEARSSRIILMGSMEEPDHLAGDWTPSSPYAAAKLCVGLYARMFQAVYGTPVTLLRPFFTYGPSQNAAKVIPYVIRSLLAGEVPRLSSCTRALDLVYIDDMIAALLAAAIAPPCAEGIDVGTGTLVPLRHVIERICTLMGTPITPDFGAIADRQFEQVRAAKTEDALCSLSWRATTQLDEGLRRTIQWYGDHPCTSKDERFAPLCPNNQEAVAGACDSSLEHLVS